jgi:hypothetical protein
VALQPFDKEVYRSEVLIPHANAETVPDAFDMLWLSPSDSWTGDELKARARSVHLYLNQNKNRGSGSARALAARLLKEVNGAAQALADPERRAELSARRQQADAAGKEEAEQRYAQVEERLAATARGSGTITAEQRRRLAHYLGDEAAFAKMLAQFKITVADERQEGPEPLDITIRKRIRTNLGSYAGMQQRRGGPERLYPTLYAFLADYGLELPVDGSSPPASALSAAIACVKQAAESMPYDDDRSLMDRLIGECETLARGKQAAYDAGRRASFADDVRGQLLVQFDEDGLIDRQALASLADGASRHGLAMAEAIAVVRSVAREANIRVEGDKAGKPLRFVRCAVCNKQAVDRGQRNCDNCGEGLYRNCPSCGKDAPATAGSCPSCGFNYLARSRAEELVAEGQRARSERRLAAALASARAAVAADRSLDAATKLVADLEHSLAEVERRWHEFDAALAERRVYEARKLVAAIATVAADVPAPAGMSVPTATREAGARVEQAERLLAEARSSSGRDRLRAESAYARALQIAVDCDEAQRALAALPPAPPGSAQVTKTAAGVNVAWQASRSVGDVEYLLVRGGASAPRTPADGEPVTRTRSHACDDVTATGGALATWSVFATRSGAHSQPVSTRPVLVAPQVRDVAAEPRDGEVLLSWNPDIGHGTVTLTRRGGGDRAVQISIDASRGTHVDRTVENGVSYEYAFEVAYAGQGARAESGPTATVKARPISRPRPVLYALVEPQAGGIRVHYATPRAGAVRVFRSDSRPEWAPGRELTPDELSRLGAPLAVQGDAAFDPHPPRTAWYVPVTSAGSLHVGGQAVRHLSAPSVTDLEVADLRSELRVTWRWPEGYAEAMVIWREDAPPTGPDDPRAHVEVVQRARYSERGCVIPVDEHSDVHVAVWTGVRDGGEPAFAAGDPSTRRHLRRTLAGGKVSYDVRRTGRFGKKTTEVVLEHPEGAPELVVVHHSSVRPPFRQSAERELGRLGPDAPVLEVPRDIRVGFVRAFLARDEDEGKYHVSDPPLPRTKL